MTVGMSYVRGRTTEETTESASLARVAGQFTSPFLSCPVRSASSQRVRLTVGTKLTETAGAVAIFFDPDNANGDAGQAANGRLFSWRDDASNLIEVEYDKAAARFEARRLNGGSGGEVTASATFTAGAATMVYVAWTATTIQLAVNGGTLQSAANTDIPTLAATTFDVGSVDGSTNYLDAAYGAVQTFSAALTQAQVDVLAALRSTRPPVIGEGDAGDVVTGTWYGGHKLVWDTTASDGAVLDLNDGAERWVRELGGAGVGGITTVASETPLRDGAAYVESQLDVRKLSVMLSVYGASYADFWSKRQELVAALNPARGEGLLMFAPDAQVYEIDAVLSAGLGYSDQRGRDGQGVPLVFDCHDPAWRVALINEATLNSVAAGLSVPVSVPVSIGLGGTSSALTNSGDLESFPEIHLSSMAAADTPVLTNTTAGKSFGLTGTYTDPNTVTVDMDDRTVVDENGASLMSARQSTAEMWSLAPGVASTITTSQSGGTYVARVRWWTRLAGV